MPAASCSAQRTFCCLDSYGLTSRRTNSTPRGGLPLRTASTRQPLRFSTCSNFLEPFIARIGDGSSENSLVVCGLDSTKPRCSIPPMQRDVNGSLVRCVRRRPPLISAKFHAIFARTLEHYCPGLCHHIIIPSLNQPFPMNNPVIKSLRLLLLTLAAFLINHSLHGQITAWTNTAGGNWNTVANWNPNIVPDAGTNAVVTNAGTYTITYNAPMAPSAIGSLTNGTPAVLTLNV